MTPFPRQPAPEFWTAKEEQWIRAARPAKVDPLGWKHQGRPLKELFHELCRPASEPRLCAYCDGELRTTSGDTIDHVAPKAVFPELWLAWHNLLPACHLCNDRYKGDQWSCALVRPDVDPVEEWFDVDLTSGALRPNAAIEDSVVRARVRLTIVVLRLNTPDRCRARLDVVRAMLNAYKRDARTQERDRPTLEERAARGPYRFVARRFVDALPPSSRGAPAR